MQVSRKVAGASIVGMGLVCVAFGMNMLSHEQLQEQSTTNPATVINTPARTYIAVTDTNGNGIEDWREEFLTEEPIVMASTTTFVMPETITDQVGIDMFESMVRGKALGPFADTETELVDTATARAIKAGTDTMYTERDIVTTNTNNITVRAYGNALGQSVVDNSSKYGDELAIVNRALQTNNGTELDKLNDIALSYKKLRDEALNTPVPDQFIRVHLDLINTYNAMYNTISGLQLAVSDPMVALVRIKRYQDDALGLQYAISNLITALDPYNSVFYADDTVMILVALAVMHENNL